MNRTRARCIGGVALVSAALAGCAPDGPAELTLSPGQPLHHTAIFQKPTKTATGYWERSLTYDWSVAKSVAPASQELGPSSSATFDYRLTATRSEAARTDVAGVRGQICVKNLGSADSQGMTIVDYVQASTNGGATWTTIATQNVDVSSNPVVSPNETACFDYDVPFVPVAGAQYRNEGAVTWTNAGNGGVPDPGTTQTWETLPVPFTLPSNPAATETDETATLNDLLSCPTGFSCTPLAGSWTLTGSQSIDYAVQVTNVSAPCSHSAQLLNTARLREDDSGQERSAPASATVTTPECRPSLRISKVADAPSVGAGNPIGFSITVHSDGPGTARGVTLSDPLPGGGSVTWVVESPPTGCSISSNLLTCTLGDMPSGTSVIVHVTGQTTSASCGVHNNTASVRATNHDAVQASASTVVECASQPLTGCTPGFWKQKHHLQYWATYAPTQSIASVFGPSTNLYSLGGQSMGAYTLLQGLSFQGGSTLAGAAEILLRAAVAGLLNATHPQVNYGQTSASVISDVSSALGSQNRDTMLGLAERLDIANNRECSVQK